MDTRAPGWRSRRTGAALAALVVLAGGVLALVLRPGSDRPASSAPGKPSATSSATPSPDAVSEDCGPDAVPDPGPASDAVVVTGAFGKRGVSARFPAPMTARRLQRTITMPGAGPGTVAGQLVDVVMTLFDGRTGKRLDELRGPVVVGDQEVLRGFVAGYTCVPLGSRVVTVFPSARLVGPSGPLGTAPGDSVVAVIDVIGLDQPPVPAPWPDAPAVRFDADGVPHLRLIGSAPSGLRLKVLQQGDGPVVRSGDAVTVGDVMLSWATHEVVDDSTILSPRTIRTWDAIPGFAAALVGQRVGSRVIVSIPPKYGVTTYRDGQEELRGQALVMVIEIHALAEG